MVLKYFAPTSDVGQAVSIVNWCCLVLHSECMLLRGFFDNKVNCWLIWTVSPSWVLDFALGICFSSTVRKDFKLFKSDEEDPAVLSSFEGFFGHGWCLLQSQSHFFHLGKHWHRQCWHFRHFLGGGSSDEVGSEEFNFCFFFNHKSSSFVCSSVKESNSDESRKNVLLPVWGLELITRQFGCLLRASFVSSNSFYNSASISEEKFKLAVIIRNSVSVKFACFNRNNARSLEDNFSPSSSRVGCILLQTQPHIHEDLDQLFSACWQIH